MSRKAILIDASNVQGFFVLPGATKDVSDFERFLRSDLGGAWNADEIVTLTNPGEIKVALEIEDASDADYTLVLFSGHGREWGSVNSSDTKICLASGDISVSEVDPQNEKRLLIFDSCREYERLQEELVLGEAVRKYAKAYDRRLESRRLFDRAVAAAGPGKSVMYSCRPGETAKDSRSFTQHLMGHAKLWKDRQSDDTTAAVLYCDRVFTAARISVTDEESSQHPQPDLGRRIRHFPFAVYID